MNSLTLETTPEAEAVHLEIVRRTPPGKKLLQISALIESCRQLAISDIKRLHPEAPEDEVRSLLAERLLSR